MSNAPQGDNFALLARNVHEPPTDVRYMRSLLAHLGDAVTRTNN